MHCLFFLMNKANLSQLKGYMYFSRPLPKVGFTHQSTISMGFQLSLLFNYCISLIFCVLSSTRGPVGLTCIASLKTKACDSTDQVVLQWSYTGGVQILPGGHRKEGCVQSFQLEKKEQFLQK